MDVALQTLTKASSNVEAIPAGIEWPFELVLGEDGIDMDTANAVFGFDQVKDRRLLISHERLSGHSHGYGVVDAHRVLANLKAVFPDARIIAVVRNQLDFLLSLYCFRVAVRGEEHRSFQDF